MAKTDTAVNELIINRLTNEQYKAALAAGEINDNELYMTPAEEAADATQDTHGYMSVADKIKLDEFEDASQYVMQKDVSKFPIATNDSNGYMSSADKAKLDEFGEAAQYVTQEEIPTFPVATQTSNGYMKALDKMKLDEFEEASQYALKSQVKDIVGYVRNPFSFNINTSNGTTSYNGGEETTLTLNKAAVGLGNVDNTADSDKYVAHANEASTAIKATTATKLDSSVGSTTRPVYFENGVPKIVGYELGSAAACSISDFATVNHTHSTATTSSAGFMSASDKTRLNNIVVMKGATSTSAGTSGLVPSPEAGYDSAYLAGDGTWKTSSMMQAQYMLAEFMCRPYFLVYSGTYTGTNDYGTESSPVSTYIRTPNLFSNSVAFSKPPFAVYFIKYTASSVTTDAKNNMFRTVIDRSDRTSYGIYNSGLVTYNLTETFQSAGSNGISIFYNGTDKTSYTGMWRIRSSGISGWYLDRYANSTSSIATDLMFNYSSYQYYVFAAYVNPWVGVFGDV